jgi:hypothetical protein
MPRAERPGAYAATAKRLYEQFLAPLVIGGDLTPGPAVGARAAVALDGGLAAVDPDLRSRVDLARVRVARRLVPVDMLVGPDIHEWALAAALHDLLFALHPSLERPLRRSAPDRLMTFAEQALCTVPAASSLAETVSRHSFFARAFELHRTDVTVSWWTGRESFLGTDPPPRLLAWPELRRVQTTTTTVPVADLPDVLRAGRRERFRNVLSVWLEKVPLTSLATCTRALVPFEWSGATLGLFSTPQGCVLGLRALALHPREAVDAALGRATLPHLKAEAWDNLARIGDVLAARALATAATDLSSPSRDPGTEEDAHFAEVLGASLALGRADALQVSAAARRGITARLLPLTQSPRGRELAPLVSRIALATQQAKPAPAPGAELGCS